MNDDGDDTFSAEASRGLIGMSLSSHDSSHNPSSVVSDTDRRTAVNLRIDTGTGNTVGVGTEGETGQTRFTRLNVDRCCRSKLNTTSSPDRRARICGWEDGDNCPRHRSRTRPLADLEPDNLYICAPVSVNKNAVLVRPSVSEALLDVTGIEAMMELRGSVSDLVGFASLLQDSEGILSRAEVTHRWNEFRTGALDSELDELGLESPTGTQATPLIGSPRGTFVAERDRNTLLSPLTEQGFGSRESQDETFGTARADDWHSAASEYDTAQTTYLLKRVTDLSDFVEELKKLDLSGKVEFLHRRGIRLTGAMGTLPSLATTQTTSVGAWIAVLQRRLNRIAESVTQIQLKSSEQFEFLKRVQEKVLTHEATFTESDKLPALRQLVIDLATEVNGSVGGIPGSGILVKIRAELAQTTQPPPSGGISFSGYSMGGAPSAAPPTNPLAATNAALEARVQRLEAALTVLTANANNPPNVAQQGGGGAGQVFPNVGMPNVPAISLANVLQRVKDLERAGSGAPIVFGGISFSNESDVRAFVSSYITTPYLGCLGDMVSMLQKLRINSPSKAEMNAEQGAAVKQGMDVVELSLLQSFAIMIPAPFDKTGDVVSSSSHPLPAVPTYQRFAAPLDGLEARITAQLMIEVTSTRGRFALASGDPMAHLVLDGMVARSISQWSSLAAVINKLQLVNTSSYGMTDAASWELVGQTVAQAFRSLRPIRACAQDLTGHAFSPKERFVRVMWTMLKAHRLLDEFIAVEWTGHPHMSGITAEYVLRNRVQPADLKKILDRTASAQLQVVALEKDVDGLEKDTDLLLTKAGVQSKRGKRQRRT